MGRYLIRLEVLDWLFVGDLLLCWYLLLMEWKKLRIHLLHLNSLRYQFIGFIKNEMVSSYQLFEGAKFLSNVLVVYESKWYKRLSESYHVSSNLPRQPPMVVFQWNRSLLTGSTGFIKFSLIVDHSSLSSEKSPGWDTLDDNLSFPTFYHGFLVSLLSPTPKTVHIC